MKPYGAAYCGYARNTKWDHGIGCGICLSWMERATRGKAKTRANKKAARRAGKTACAHMED
jgi:hypothetical protein